MTACLRFAFIVILALVASSFVFAQTDNSTDPLVRVLQAKGVLTEAEARSITANATPAVQRDRLAALLRDKGVISSSEFEAVRTNTTAPSMQTITADYKTTPTASLPSA